MGLDMYAYAVSALEAGDQQTDFDMKKFSTVEREFAYWRKFNHLHGWMERLYREKGGEEEVFNCCTVRLMLEDLDRLEKALEDVKAGHPYELKPTSGFFFGDATLYDGDVENLENFLERAREAIGRGAAVLYDSWW